jgi:hypothetical protein
MFYIDFAGSTQDLVQLPLHTWGELIAALAHFRFASRHRQTITDDPAAWVGRTVILKRLLTLI